MILDILYLVGGLVFILVGANLLTDGSAAVAKRWGVSNLVIGLTVVAFGTSAPELVISIVSSLDGSAELAIGNVVGSNIFNVFVIIGLTSLVRPIKVDRNILTNDIPLVFLSALALLAIGCGKILDGATANVLTRVDGILLLLFFAIFMRYTFAQAASASPDEVPDNGEVKTMPLWKSLLWIVIGLAGLIIGGDRFVAGASGIAAAMGVSEAIIGLTIVAAGTSLPELATSITAAVKGKPGLALGNVIGSNIFNIFLVLGCAGVVNPLPFGNIGLLDLGVMTGACFLFWLFGRFFRNKTITRPEGVFLFLCYLAYISYLVLQAQ
ncbi:MAG: calcium/sodium antiporter [Muribaculaceae bacterium]|nr:calcium/sodium antiporter [Muribaculaceae bacterium]